MQRASVPTTQDLRLFDATKLLDGAVVIANNTGQPYTLSRTDTSPIDESLCFGTAGYYAVYAVVAAAAKQAALNQFLADGNDQADWDPNTVDTMAISATIPGRWRRDVRKQGENFMPGGKCFIDGVNGSDENDGLTATTALKTNDELVRRAGLNPVIPSLLVTLLSKIDGITWVGLTGRVTYVGARTVLHSGVVTASGKADKSANQAAYIEDSALTDTWTNLKYVGCPIDAADGSMSSFIAADLGTANHRARTVEWTQAYVSSTPRAAVPGDSMPYNIVQLTEVSKIEISGGAPKITFKNINCSRSAILDIANGQIYGMLVNSRANVYFVGCQLNSLQGFSSTCACLVNCWVRDINANTGINSAQFLHFGNVLAGSLRGNHGVWSVNGSPSSLLLPGASFIVYRGYQVQLEGLGIFDCLPNIAPVNVMNGGFAYLPNYNFGANNGGPIVQVNTGGQAAYNAPITIATNNPAAAVNMAGTMYAWTQLPVVAPASLAGMYQFFG